jgi:arylsulfatase A-like enzyme
MDNAIGNILDHLDTLGLADNTLVVFTSDHGHYYGHHGLIAKGPFHYDDGIRVPMIARLPNHIPAGMQQNTLQSLVDYAPTFLSFCGIDIPAEMSGHNQQAVWCGDSTQAREHVIIENRHQPTTVHMKTYIDTDYKLTVYFNQNYGEIFDRHADPAEINNLWSDVTLRHQLIERMLRAEMLKEEPLTDAHAQLANKSQAMYRKTMNHTRMDYQITFDPAHNRYELFNLWDDPHKTSNLWHSEKHQHIRAELVQMLLWSRWASEPLWMPRVGIA